MGVPATLSQVPAQTPYIQYVATSGQTVFPYPFEITQDSDLVAVVNGNTQATDSGYSLSGVGNATGGNLTFTAGRTAGDIVTLYRDIPIERISQIAQNSGFSSAVFNAEFNNIYLLLQQIENSLGFALQIPNTNNPAPSVTLTPAAYANKQLTFDANGNPQPGVLTSLGSLTPAIVAPLAGGPITTAEGLAGVTIVNFGYAPGVVDRYGTNTTPGTTNMKAAISAALAQAVQAGGAPVRFLAQQDYYCGQLTSAADLLFDVVSPSHLLIEGNHARIVTQTTATTANATPFIFEFKDPNDVTIRNLDFYDSGTDVTQVYKGPSCLVFTTTTSTDCSGVVIDGCNFDSIVNPMPFTNSGGGTGRIRGIFIRATVKNSVYGGSFQEQGDDVQTDITVSNVVRGYFPYGVAGHNADVHVYQDGSATGSNACIDIKRYSNDTRNLRIRADFHGYTTQYGSLVNFEMQANTGTFGITKLGSITGGSSYTDGKYWGVPLTGGSGTGATAQIVVNSGAVVSVFIMNPGKGYVAADSLSASAANIGGTGSGFAVTVSNVGGTVDGIEVDLDLTDAQIANGAAPGIPFQFRSYTPGGVLNTTTTDKWDRISLRGSMGQWPWANPSNPQFINIASTQSARGRLMIEPGLWSAFDNKAQVFPGFDVYLSNTEYFISELGDLTATPVFIDLTQFEAAFWALEITVTCVSDYSTTSSFQTTGKYFVQGAKGFGVGATPTINNLTNIYLQQGATLGLNATASTVVTAATGGLDINFENFTGSNATARVHVKHLTKLL